MCQERYCDQGLTMEVLMNRAEKSGYEALGACAEEAAEDFLRIFDPTAKPEDSKSIEDMVHQAYVGKWLERIGTEASQGNFSTTILLPPRYPEAGSVLLHAERLFTADGYTFKRFMGEHESLGGEKIERVGFVVFWPHPLMNDD